MTSDPLKEALAMTGLATVEELIDMANVGQSLMNAIDAVTAPVSLIEGWSPADDPAEIVGDLYNSFEESIACHKADLERLKAAEAGLSGLSTIAKRLIKWDTDFPVNSWNGYAGLKELDRIIADAKGVVTKAGGEFVDELGSPSPSQETSKKPIGWIVRKKSGDGIFMSAAQYDEVSAAAEADIHDRGYFAVFALPVEGVQPFQSRVGEWMQACFGEAIAADKTERAFRFLEEALELAQACGTTSKEARLLVDYVYGRPAGEPFQEVGGVQVTLAALCTPNGIDMADAAETELARVWKKLEQIRAKHDSKPQGIRSALPGGADA